MFLNIKNNASEPAMAPQKSLCVSRASWLLEPKVTLKLTGLMYGPQRRCKFICPDSSWKKDVFAVLEALRMWEA